MGYYENYYRYNLFDGTAYSDYLYNYAGGVTIYGYDGNDYIYSNTKSSYTVNGGWGYVTISGGYGADTIDNQNSNVSISGGAGNDSINASGFKYVTIYGGTGNDVIYSGSNYNLFRFYSGDGYDTIYDWSSTNTLNLGGAHYKRSTVNSNVVISLTSGNYGAITLSGASGKTINITNGIEDKGETLNNTYSYNTLYGSYYVDSITNSGSTVKIYTYDDNDKITNSGSYVTIDGGSGADTVHSDNTSNINSHVLINSGTGNDSIYCRSNSSTVNGGDDNDTISNVSYYSSVNGGYGNDSIYSYSYYATINGGAGNDTIILHSAGSNNIIDYQPGEGYDLVKGFSSNSTLRVGGGTGTYSSTKSNGDIVITSGAGKVTLQGAAALSTVHIQGVDRTQTPLNISNSYNYKTVEGSNYNDTITNSGSTVKIYGYGGNDSITLRYWAETESNKVTLDAGDGYDTIYVGGKYNSVNASYGNDSIYVHGSYGTIYGGAGSDTMSGNNYMMKIFGESGNDYINITNYWYNTIDGGSDNDTIAIEGGQKHSISGGAGADRISLGSATNSTIYYATGGGSDTIWSWSSSNMLNISGNYNAPKKSGNDILINTGSGSILVKDAVKFGSININNRTVKISDDIVFENVTQQDVIRKFMSSLDSSMMALEKSNSATNTQMLLDTAVRAASGNKYSTLEKAVAEMVRECNNSTSANDFLRNSCGINLYNDDTGAISGSDANGVLKTAESIIPESGTKRSLDLNTYNGYYVYHDNKFSGLTVRYTDVGSITNDKQHIMDCAYTWWMSEITKLIEKSYGYSFSDSNSKYNNLYLRFENNGNYLAYTNYYKDGVTVTVNMDYYNGFKSNDFNATSPNGQGYLDRVIAHETVHAIMMSKFKDRFWNLPQFITEGTAELIHGIDDFRTPNIENLANDSEALKNKLSDLKWGTGDSLSYAAGYMFLRWLAKHGATSNNSSSTASVLAATQKEIPTGATVKNKVMTISTKFTGKSINLTDYATNLVKADASALTKSINIFGNKNDNFILGGKKADYLAGGAGSDTLSGGKGSDTLSGGSGNDSLNGGSGNDSLYSGTGINTLTGGSGNNLFVYEGGNLTITDYKVSDRIKIASGTLTKVSLKGSNVVLTVEDGTINLKKAKGLNITIIDSENNVVTRNLNDTIMNVDDSTPSPVKMDSAFKTVDASKRTTAVKITGNTLANSILGGKGADNINGGKGDDTLNGGAAGNDTLTGGAGKDVFVYTSGKDVIADYAAGDKISIGAAISKASVSSKNVVFTTASGSLTVTSGKGQTLAITDSKGKSYSAVVSKTNSMEISLTNSTASPITLDAAIKSVDASKRTKAVKITGNALANSITGGSGNDSLTGGKGSDTLRGGKGNDTLTGGKGDDSLWGNAGADKFIYKSGDGNDVIYGFENNDLLQITGTFSASYNRAKKEVAFKVGSGSVTLKDFGSTTLFHVNNDTWQLSGGKLRQK